VYFCAMESTRQLKVSALLKTDLGIIFQQQISDIVGSYAMVTVTKVSVTRDLSLAKVYLSVFGEGDKQKLLKAIQRSHGLVRKYLADKIRHQVRVIPELMFYLDDSLDYMEHIDDLLHDK
jgi:ribosome-binding factor A